MRNRSPLPFFTAAALGGAALAYFLDPQSGRRRRHQSRDKARSFARHATKRARKLVHHVSADAAGAARRAAHAARPPADVQLDDATLVDKVESIVFRDHDFPKGQVNINAENGVVFLRGQVDRSELVEALEARVRKVRGVRGVENLLRTPAEQPPASS
jgi:hyperosmotically inducible periplasmic protein